MLIGKNCRQINVWQFLLSWKSRKTNQKIVIVCWFSMVLGKAVKTFRRSSVCYFFFNSTARQSLNKNFHLACLPSTLDAVVHHSMRVYMQVQDWLGKSLPLTTWGWKKHRDCVLPVTADKPVAIVVNSLLKWKVNFEWLPNWHLIFPTVSIFDRIGGAALP